jgi:hypothetical protein
VESDNEQRAVAPFRHRHDGWTPERQERFLERLAGTGCVREACRGAGLSKTSAYRAYQRMPDFAMRWDRALAARRPMMEDAAFERAVHGAVVPLTRMGKVVGKRRQFSDALLRFLIEREDRRQAAAADARRVVDAAEMTRAATREETNAVLMKKLKIVEERLTREARDKAIAFADRMVAEGKAP